MIFGLETAALPMPDIETTHRNDPGRIQSSQPGFDLMMTEFARAQEGEHYAFSTHFLQKLSQCSSNPKHSRLWFILLAPISPGGAWVAIQ
jgi:hypothetical protein